MAKSQTASEPDYAKSEKDKLPWYSENIDKYLVPETQKFLEEYSRIPRDQQSKHVHDIRDKAFNIRSYPCTGLGVFLIPYISHSPAYSAVLERLKSGATMLDVGCFLGTDFRRLVYDGAPSDSMYGVDIVSHWDVGFEYFNDRGRFHATLIVSDILSRDNPELEALKGKMDIISISAVLHQWTWDKQVECAKRLVEFSSGKGALVLGHQVGNVEGGNVTIPQATTFRQNAETMARLWEQVGQETGTRWDCKARLMAQDAVGWDPKDLSWMDSKDRVLDFVVTRLE